LAGSWAFVARSPVRVVGTLPADKTALVPTDTGIEITFDQDGVELDTAHLNIAPAVAGRLEPHGRTWAFVPNAPLAAATLFTVTVRKGVGIVGSSEVLDSDVVFRFETLPATTPSVRAEFSRSTLEVRPNEQPAITIYIDRGDKDLPTPASMPVEVHR